MTEALVRPARIAGLDVARALALFGMFAAHVGNAGTMRDDGWRWLLATHGRASALFALLALLIWYSGSLWLTFWTLATSTAVLVGFAVLALLLLRGGRALGMQAGSGWRLALAGLQRRRNENIAQILIFGLAIMLLLNFKVVSDGFDRAKASLFARLRRT